MGQALRVTVWNEGLHEKLNEEVQKVYPDGIGTQIARSLQGKPGIATVHVAELDHPDHGLPDHILDTTDVLTWWGHLAHDQVSDAIVDKVYQRVLDGMGLLVLHSGHYSKIFKRLMGTTCSLKWREIGERERLWVVDPGHPIVDGLPEYIELPHVEMYGEHFDIPQPDQLVLISWFQGGEVFRSGCCWHRGKGKIFYFRPGHETFPIYYNENIQKVLYNGVRWLAPTGVKTLVRDNVEPLEKVTIEP
ncbi:MAG: ThuA domain-containing protein [Candidatus Hydrogenedentes bacterium]|nr:ThuA domain-containing protein [Candidatus Hydrogenedentota bacterium]